MSAQIAPLMNVKNSPKILKSNFRKSLPQFFLHIGKQIMRATRIRQKCRRRSDLKSLITHIHIVRHIKHLYYASQQRSSKCIRMH